jgi:uncharacterized membrane protein YeaQ/YmgE (transglycosylase-associated protein family)
MAPLFWFLIIGVVLGLATGIIKHEDWIGFVADVEMGLLGAIVGGMSFILIGHHLDDVVGAIIAAMLTAAVFLSMLKRVIYREPTHHHP